ncbi:Ig-like domain-containing protein [Azospirillum argentinense]|uniref:Ig-like domain-containing protein n=1 Tax=Azospirillum argentinense TaxID=2970906 RepID=UPI0032E0436D
MAHKRGSNGNNVNGRSGKTHKPSSSMFAMALEPRFMFDAAGAVTVAEVHQQPDQPAPGDQGAAKTAEADKLADWAAKETNVPVAAPPAASAPPHAEPAAVTAQPAQVQGTVRSVVFVDTSVNDYQTLIKDIAPDAKVVLLNSQQEALGQMANALSGMSGLDSIHVVSHGNEGHLYIAGRAYWADGLANRGQDLQAIGAALKPGGDLLFYACNVGAGQAGQEFVQTVHRLTGADVAVSNDQTGSAPGQNWTLEVQSGSIEAAIPFALSSMETFSGRLGTVVVTSATGTAAGSLNHAIVNAAAGDVIEFSSTLISSKISLGVTTTVLTAPNQSFTINGDVNGDGIADITISGASSGNVPTTTDYRGILFNSSGNTLTVKNVIMERFYSASALQGALTLQNGSLVVDGVTFKDNLNNAIATTTAATSLTIRNSVFRDNASVVTGTAGFAVVRAQVTGTLTIENSLFADNNYVMNMGSSSALYPGSIIVQYHNTAAFTVNIRNVTIVNNSYINNDAAAVSVKTAGIGVYSGGSAGTGTLNVYNTIIAGNSGNLGGTSFADPNAIIYNSAGVTLNQGNNYQGAITGNATFVDSTNADHSLRDYRPASTATTFINAGDSSNANRYGGSYDIRGIDRIRDGALDIGAYEVHWNAGEPSVDLNGAGGGSDESVSSGTPSSGVLIAPNATLAQTDTDTRLLGATITLSGVVDTGNETLTLSTADISTARMFGIAVLANDGATITLSGAASVANYQAVIRLIQYKNSAGSFTAGARTATVVVNDGETTSTARTSTITLGTVVDTTPPTISSIAVSGTPAANASSVTYTVTFSEGVSGVDSSDFTLATTGTASGTIGTVTQVSASVYTVSITGISGAGTLGLNLKGTGTGIKDTANNDIAAGFTGSAHTVDLDAPVFTSSATASVPENTTAVVTLAATDSSGPVTYSLVGGADQAKFSLSGAALTFATAPDYESPTDSDGNNVYVVVVRATDANGNTTDQTISVTVTDVNESSPSAAPVVSGLSILDLRMYVTDGDDLIGGANDSATAVLVGVPGNVDYQAYASFDMDVEFLSGTAARITFVIPPGGYNTQGGNFTYSFTFENGPNGSLGSFTQVTKNLTASSANFANESQIVGSVNGKVFSFYMPGTFAPTGQGVAVGDKLVFDIVMSVQPSETLSYTAGSGAQVIDQGTAAAVADTDSATFNGGNLTVAVDSVTANDVLGVRNQGTGAGQIGVSGNNITYGGSVIGTVAGGNGADLIITFNANADAAAVSALMANITYATTSTANSSRLVSFTVTDDTGNTSLPGFVGVSVAAGDTTAPTVNSIAVSGTPTANASSVTYTVTFSEDVSGVDAADFTLATTGTASGTIGTVTQVSASVYTVSVTGISGAGTLGLNLKGTGTGIKDTANNDIAVGFTGGTHTVDQVAPTFDVAAATSSITNTGFTLSASLDEAGTIYYVVVARNATAPTAAEVEAGTASGGGAALKSGNLSASSSPFDGSGSITGLTGGTDYDLYVVAKDSAGNLMSAPVKVSVSTTGGASNGAPVNSDVPNVTGTATVGNALSGGTGTWSDPDGDSLSYTYQWYRADDVNGTNAVSISGATSANYTLTSSDAHKYLRVAVIANDGNSNTTTAYSAYTAILNSAPVNSVAPNVTGTATVGNALSTTNGTWSDPDGDGRSYTYQWYRADDVNGTNAASISGATSSNYTLVAGDLNKYLRVVVTANDGKGGTQTASSGYSSQVVAAGNGAPVNSVVPNVTGTATVGNALSGGTGTWSDPDGDSLSYTYQWYRADDINGTNAVSISGATSANYMLTTSDAHKYLRVAVIANDGNSNTTTAYSAYTAILNSAPVNSVAPNVTGTATVGNALSTTNGTWSDPDGDGRSYTYQWYRADDVNGTNAASISGATSSNYTLTSSDAHKYLRVVVTADDGKGGTQTASSGYTAILNSAPVNSAVPNVTGTATVGNALSTTNGTWSDPDGDGRSYTYQWYRADDVNGTNAASISGATSSNYTLTSSDAHKYLRVVVTADDGKGGTQTANSGYTEILNSAPVLSTDERSLTAIDEDATGNNGDTVAAILASAGSATDVDGNALGIAITGTNTSHGTWQYKTGAGNWTTITGVSGASALLLASTDRVRFVPNADYNGSVTGGVTFKAWDQTSGTAGTTVGNDTTVNGGQGSGHQFSVASATAGIAVTAVNDAPVLTDTVLTLPSVAQAAGAPSGAVGAAVSSLVALGTNVSDVDSGAVTGIALVGVDTSEGGTWYYSTNGGATWTAVGTVNDSGNALLLRTTDRLYYQPTGANAGILNAAITFRAWDQTSGTAGTKVATAGGGGISAFSAGMDTASLSITPATLASTVTLAAASDTGSSNSDNITKATSVTFDGSGANANANTTVRLYANGTLVATTTADASGAYSFTGVDVSGLSGAVDFTVRQVIAGMESADSAVRTVTFDRTAPTVAITTVTGDNVLNAAESAVAQTVAGTTTGVENGQTVTVTLNGKTYSTTVTNNAWSLSIPSGDLLALTDGGTYTVTADLADVAGNAAVQATRSVSVDRTPPTLAIATVAGDNVLNAADSAVGQTVSGVTNGVENGQTVTVTLNGKTYSTTVTNNTWSLTVPPGDLLALTDGASYTVTASLTDAAGNPNQATRSLSVDRTPPSVVSVTPPPARTYLPGETVSFFVQLSETVVVNGGNPILELAVGSDIRNATYNAAGSTGTLLRFDYVVPVGDRAPQGISVLGLALNGSIVTDLAQGPLLTALAGIGDTSQVRIDTPIPAKPVGTALSGLSDSGVSATDRLTNVTRPTLSGTAEANATVTVLVDGIAVGTTVADENGFWVHRLQTPLTDGTHNITTTATNRFGIVSDPSDALAVVIDTAVPVAPAPLVTSATVAGVAAGERISGIAKPSLAGTTEAGSTVNVLVDGRVAGTAVADANGAWTFQFTAALADGTHSVQVQATDRAGNASSLSAVTTLTIDTTPPAAPTVALNTTAGSTPAVQGTAEANSLVTVTINGQTIGTARASATGTWQLALASDLSVGSYVIAAKASDAVGNTGNAGTTTYSVAPPPPPPPAVAASTGNTTTAASSSNVTAATSSGIGTTQTVGPTLGTAPTLPGLQTSSDAGRVITSSSIGSGSGAGNGNSSTDAGRSITIGNIGNSTSSDAGRSITISAMGGAPSSGGTGGSAGSGVSGVVSSGGGLGSGGLGGGLGGGVGGGGIGAGSGLGGSASGGLGAGAGIGGGAFGGASTGGGPGAGLGTGGPAAGATATGVGTGNGSPNGAAGGTPGGSVAPGGSSSATGGLGSAPGNRGGGQTGPGSTIENAPANRPDGQGGPQGQPQGPAPGRGQSPAGDAPAGDPGIAPTAPDGQGQDPGPRADLDGTSPARPAFSRQVAQIHGAADAQTAALLAALTSHVPPGSRAA